MGRCACSSDVDGRPVKGLGGRAAALVGEGGVGEGSALSRSPAGEDVSVVVDDVPELEQPAIRVQLEANAKANA